MTKNRINQGYTFDHIGNLKERSDNLYGVVQSFCHDEMNRLTAARFDGCAASDADYTYDPLVSRPTGQTGSNGD